MDPIVIAFGTALVGAAATDSWQQVHDAIVGLWHRVRHRRQSGVVEAASQDDGKEVAGDLTMLREQVLQARHNNDAATERALEGIWQLKTQQLVQAHPSLADELKAELKQVLDQVLTPALLPAEQARIGTIIQHATAHDSSTIWQIGQLNTGTGS
jgi:hypothetical protein